MSEKEQLVDTLYILINKIQNDNFSKETLTRLSQDIFPYVHSITPIKYDETLDEKKIVEYMFRGWAVTRLLEKENISSEHYNK